MALRSTGWLDIRSLIPAEFELHESAPVFKIRRVGDRVDFVARLRWKGQAVSRSTAVTLLAFPEGFQAAEFAPHGVATLGAGVVALVGMFSSILKLDVMPVVSGGTWQARDQLVSSASWWTARPWPTTLPGTPI